ncbi:MAG: hypothetical protein AAB367_03460 [Patescibacteria group bacterium]
MKTFTLSKKLLTLGVIGILTVPLMTLAAEFRSGDQPSIQANESINGDMYIAGGSVASIGTVHGDLFAAGGSVVVSGNVDADLTVGGGNITIISNIADDARIGGGNITFQGSVGGDLFVGGGQVHIGGSRVGGDVVVGGGMVRIDAPVTGNVYVGGGEIYINAPIGGNVKIEADRLTLGSAARITGSLDYHGARELVRETGAEVAGEVRFTQRADKKELWLAFASAWFIGKFFALLASALLVGLFFRRYANEIIKRVASAPLRQIGSGLVIAILMPIISVAILFTIIGIPLGITGLLSFVIVMIFMWILSPIVVGSMLARYIRKREIHHTSWKTILLGVVVYTAVGAIPFVGKLIQIVILFAVLGAALRLKWNIAREWR